MGHSLHAIDSAQSASKVAQTHLNVVLVEDAGLQLPDVACGISGQASQRIHMVYQAGLTKLFQQGMNLHRIEGSSRSEYGTVFRQYHHECAA